METLWKIFQDNKIKKELKMKDILVVGKLKEGSFEKFMGFMQSDEGMT